MYPSRTFHSSGMVQSKTRKPDGTSHVVRGMYSRIRSIVFLTPSPVMLRQIGYMSEMNRCMACPVPSAERSSGISASTRLAILASRTMSCIPGPCLERNRYVSVDKPGLRDRHHKLGTPAARKRKLTDDLPLQVPGQDQYVVRLSHADPFRFVN